MNLATEAVQFLRSTQHGLLSTFSAKFDGYPFGSVTPFVLNHQCEPVVLISTVAEHTKNIIANPKVSLLVFAEGDDLLANARLTLIGEAILVNKSDVNLKARYLRYMPQATSYFDMHDFCFYRLEIHQTRYIAGFGKMGWIEGNLLHSAEKKLADVEGEIVTHMNQDHEDSLIAYAKHYHNIEATSAEMLGIDVDGFDLKVATNTVKNLRLRLNFDQAIHDAHSARASLIAMSKVSKV